MSELFDPMALEAALRPCCCPACRADGRMFPHDPAQLSFIEVPVASAACCADGSSGERAGVRPPSPSDIPADPAADMGSPLAAPPKVATRPKAGRATARRATSPRPEARHA
jgi:hypothetical protein